MPSAHQAPFRPNCTGRAARRARLTLILAVAVLLPLASAPACQPAPAPQAEDDDAPADPSRKGGWRLAHQDSPYLQQHADNLVNWFPWGPEAFELARELDWPVFLSVGYSSCHWCHVMEHESFEDQETADYLNRHFINVKVDREQRPDVDARYMEAVVAMTGSGGWPLSAWLTPDGEPFYGGTYFPKEPRFGRPSFAQVLQNVTGTWRSDRERILEAVANNEPIFNQDPMPEAGIWVGDEILSRAEQVLAGALDTSLGGLKSSGPTRFPPSQVISFLLRRAARHDGVDLTGALVTLDAMAAGGMADHVGGGFHRYSTDPQWKLPHFEKMLYDNALLAAVYTQAAAVTGEARFAHVARGTLRWLADDMRSPEGLYYAARDADSLPFDADGQPVGDHKEEGDVYSWTAPEVTAVLGDQDSDRFCALYEITESGNFERGRSIPRRELGAALPDGVTQEWIDECMSRLRQAREGRPQAFRDEKCLSAWNGMTLTAFATAGRLLDDAGLLDNARALGHAALQHLTRRDSDGRLTVQHQRYEGRSSGQGDLADHAALALGLLDAYSATGDTAFLTAAWELAHTILARFEDPLQGGFFQTTGADPLLPSRGREMQDGAVPSSQSLALQLLLRLSPLDDAGAFTAPLDRSMSALAALAGRAATSFPSLAIAVDAATGPLAEVVLAGVADDKVYLQLFATARAAFVPAELLIPHAEAAAAALATVGVAETPSLLAERTAHRGKPLAWICVDGTCLAPVKKPADFAAALASLHGR